ncbi:MAG: 30S ribosomal protein S1 [Syntrophales bacterium]|jgi:small subunit ribosomal protein S1|nr:30S ribosomal protein S1 [Syntrophales bacterium]MDY0044497.1 30S ribosomal protein S1 [Syntrophales bacterium]
MVNENNIMNETQINEKENKGGEGATEIDHGESLTFDELFEQSLQEISTGKMVTGRVVEVNDDFVMVDVGYKTEGRINAVEFKDDTGEITCSVGDEIEVVVDRKTEEDLILSRDKAVRTRVWDDIVEAHEANELVTGTIIKKVKGGLTVDIGCYAFLPGSQVDVRPIRDLDKFIGQTMEFEILKYDRKRNNVVLSRKAILEKEMEEQRQKVLENMEEGMVIDGTVKNITDYGLFVDLGGIDGLLHITDMSWGRIRHPSESFSKGDSIQVKVLNFDSEKGRVSLGLKQLTENPWDTITESYPVGMVVEGEVVSIMDYGAFVEIESGVEGLVHVSEMFWTKKIKHPSKVVSVGDKVSVQVLEVDPDNKRISLGLKQTMPNPWEVLREKYPVGQVVKGKIKNIADFGIFVGIDDDIDGLVHVSDLSWKKRIKHPSELYKKGQEIDAVVLSIDAENGKFSLGVKQLEMNPWEELKTKLGTGAVVSGKVTNVTDFGIFVEIEEGIEGLVHISELSRNRVKSTKDVYKVGDTVNAVIKNIDVENQKVGLSIKDYEISTDQSSQNQYVNNNEKVVSNLGDILAGIKL